MTAQFKGINSLLRYGVFKSFCMSVYGCNRWDFSLSVTELFYIQVGESAGVKFFVYHVQLTVISSP